MKSEDAKKHWDIIVAFKEGKIIQYEITKNIWEDVSNAIFSSYTNYRIKPEPKLVPFTYEDASSLIGRSVRNKTSGSVGLIIFINKTFLKVPGEITFSYFLDQYVFLNGEPCGKFINE